ncbi:MAG: ABC transporter transmembrane domain-containing protein, partial [Gammaproteobacteria bacterium]
MRHIAYDANPPRGFNWSAARLILPWLGEFRARIALAMACLVLAKAASIGAPYLLKATVDGLDPGAPGALAMGAVLALVAGYGLARFLNVLLGEVRDTLFGRVTERAMRRIGLRVFEHLHALDLSFHLERRTGGLARDIERGTNGISFLMRFLVFNIVPTLLEIAVVTVLLSWQYGLAFGAITLVSVLCYGAFSAVATEWRTGFVREANRADSITKARAVDSLLNYETVKYFCNETHEARRYDEDLAAWELARRRNRLSLFALNAGQALIVALAMGGAMALAATGVREGRMSVGDFVLVNAFMMQLFMPLNFLGMVYREIKSSLASIEEMFALLAVEPEIHD